MIEPWDEIQKLSDKEKIEKLVQSLIKLSKKVDGLESRINDLEDKTGNLESEVESHRIDISYLSDRITDLEE